MKTTQQIIEEEGHAPTAFTLMIGIFICLIAFTLTIAVAWCIAAGLSNLIDLIK